jgi:hypothetical protein
VISIAFDLFAKGPPARTKGSPCCSSAANFNAPDVKRGYSRLAPVAEKNFK